MTALHFKDESGKHRVVNYRHITVDGLLAALSKRSKLSDEIRDATDIRPVGAILALVKY